MITTVANTQIKVYTYSN